MTGFVWRGDVYMAIAGVPTLMWMGLNVTAILAAVIASNILGMVWFAKPVFGKVWLHSLGAQRDVVKKMKRKLSASVLLGSITTLISVVILAYVIKFGDARTWMEGASFGFWMWLGFIAPIQLGDVIWQGRSVKSFLIEASYQLVNMVVIGAILVLV